MTTTQTTQATTPDGTNEVDPYIRRLAASANGRDADLSACTRWKFGTPTPAVIRIAGGTTNDEFYINATLAQIFAIFQAGRTRVAYGHAGDNLGTTMRALGRSGARGVSDPAAKRDHELLLTAATWPELHRVLVRIAKTLKATSAGKPWDTPDWQRLHQDLTRWCDPAHRNQVRLEWGQGFVTNPTRKNNNQQVTDTDAVATTATAH